MTPAIKRLCPGPDIIHSSLTDALFKFAAVYLQGKAVRASSVVLLLTKTTSQYHKTSRLLLQRNVQNRYVKLLVPNFLTRWCLLKFQIILRFYTLLVPCKAISKVEM